MIKILIKNLDDFKRLINNRGTVYFSQKFNGSCPEKFTYYVISKEAGVDVINIFASKNPLKFTDQFDPEDPENIDVGFLVEVEDISFCSPGGSS